VHAVEVAVGQQPRPALELGVASERVGAQPPRDLGHEVAHEPLLLVARQSRRHPHDHGAVLRVGAGAAAPPGAAADLHRRPAGGSGSTLDLHLVLLLVLRPEAQ
jgi:hypothetical protein